MKKIITKDSTKCAPCLHCGYVCEIIERTTLEGPDEAHLRPVRTQLFVEACPKSTLGGVPNAPCFNRP